MSYTTTELNPASRQQALADMAATELDVLVIGAGQAGLAASYELRRRGFRGYAPDVDHTEEATASCRSVSSALTSRSFSLAVLTSSSW